MKERIKFILTTVVSPILFAVFIFASIFSYMQNSYDGIMTDTESTLNEDINRVASSVTAKLNGNYYVLEFYAGIFAAREELDAQVIAGELSVIVNKGDFEKTLLALPNGDAVSDDGARISIADTTFFADAMSEERGIWISEDNAFTDESVCVLCVPIINGEGVRGAVAGYFSTAGLLEMIKTDGLDKDSYSLIVNSDGNVVAKSENSVYSLEQNNVFDFYRQCTLYDGEILDRIAKDLKNGRMGMVEYEYGGNSRYSTYAPLGVSDWFIVSVVPSEYVRVQRIDSFRSTIILTAEILFASGFILIVLVFRERRKEFVIRAEKEIIAQSRKEFELLEDLSDTIIVSIDLVSGEVRCNENYVNSFGREMWVRDIDDLKEDNPYVCEDDVEEYKKFINGIFESCQNIVHEFRLIDAQKNYVWYRFEFMKLLDSAGKAYKIIGKMTNIDKTKTEIHRLTDRAESDRMTKLFNHETFREKVERELEEESKKRRALFLLDVDNFKEINDRFGHFEGDKLLIGIAGILAELFENRGIVGRMGGDEFAAFISDASSNKEINDLAEEINREISLLAYADNNMTVSCSVGIIVFSGERNNFDNAYKKADKALYRAKKAGKDGFLIQYD